MSKASGTKQTRYAVVSRSTGKVLKNSGTRELAREWKRDSGKSNLAIFDRDSDMIVS